MSESWEYEKRPLNGGAGGEAFRIVFNGSGMEPAATLAREAIQNSVDAALDRKGEVPITFELRELHGEDRRRFEQAARLDQIRARQEQLELPQNNALVRTKGSLNLLYISDYETTGLCGDPTSGDSKLRKLLMEIGGSEKIEEDRHSGGSYGFGKAVYGGSSRIATIIAYSRTNDHNDKPISVLMGCTYHRGHEFEGKITTGRAFFGEKVEVEGEGIRYDPFMNEKADRIAASLGMEREPNELGTTIIIIDTPYDITSLKKGIEDNWWPRLEDKLLDIELIDFDGSEATPTPKQRKDLAPFIEAYNVARGVSPVISGKSFTKTFNKTGGLGKGKIGLFVMDEEDGDPDDEANLAIKDTIVLIRSPLMVVQHYGKRTIGIPPIAGAFIADDDIDGILRRSEPPEHNRWDETAQRLDTEKNEPALVKSVLSGSWKELKDFQKRAQPSEVARPKRISRLERTLSKWFGPASTRPKPPPVPARPTPISLEPAPRVLLMPDGQLTLAGAVSVSLNSNSDEEEMHVAVTLKALIVEEDSVSTKDRMKLDVSFDEDVFIKDGVLIARLTKHKKTEIAFNSAPYDASWTVQFVPEVTPYTPEGAK